MLSVNLSGWERAFERAPRAPAVVEVHGPDRSLVDRRVLHVNRRETQLNLAGAGPYEVRVILPSGEVLAQGFVYRDEPVPPLEFSLEEISPYGPLQRAAMVQRLASPVVGDLRAPTFVSTWVRLWERAGAEWHLVPPPLEVEESQWLSDAVRYRLELARKQYVLQVGGPAVPWKLICLPAAGLTDLIVRPAGPRSVHPLELTAVSGNPTADALLGYLSRGAIPAAVSLAEQEPELAQLLLHDKVTDPYAAAIGGYYLLRVGDVEERMRSWPANLADWMDWISDGPIIRGWQLLKGARPREDETARDRFLQAVERGLPVYAQGLRLLVDGLKVIARKAHWKDRAVQGALEQIGRFAASADWSRPFVTFTGSAPDCPDAAALIGFPESRDRLIFLHSMTVGDLIDHNLVRPGTSWELNAQLIRPPRAERVTATVTPAGMIRTDWEYPTPEAALLPELLSATDAWGIWRRADGLTLADLREQAHRRPRAESSAMSMAEAIRAVAHVPLDDPDAVGELLGELSEAGAADAVDALAARAADHAPLDDPDAVARLLQELSEAGAADAVQALAARAAAHAPLDDPDRSRDLADAVDRARDLARDLAEALARDLDYARDLARARDLAEAIDHARHLARDLDFVHYLTRARNRAQALARDLALYRDRAHDLDRARYLDRARDRAQTLVRDLARARKRAGDDGP